MLDEPPHRVIADFIHGCSADDSVRTAATTALVLSFWQARGTKLTAEVPSLLLVPPGQPGDDPVDALAKGLVYDKRENKPRLQKKGPFMGIPVEKAPRVMENAYLERQSLRGNHVDHPDKYWQARNAEALFRKASLTAFGNGGCRPYAQAWHPDYGLLTDDEGQAVLRLNDDKDRAALVSDLKDTPEKLVFPQGVGPDLSPADKHIALSGALDLKQTRSALELVRFCQPALFLPHLATQPLKLDNRPALKALAYTWRHADIASVRTSPRLPASDWIRAYRDALRKRLSLLPDDYGFAIQQTLRRLDGVCSRIVSFAGRTGAEEWELAALIRDLYGHTLRGIVLSVAGLSWFGLGLHLGPECELLREKALKLLKALRGGTKVSLTDLLKNYHLSAQGRDALLDRLEAEHLLKRDGKEVLATTYKEFVEGLYAREEFPKVNDCWPELQEQLKTESSKGM